MSSSFKKIILAYLTRRLYIPYHTIPYLLCSIDFLAVNTAWLSIDVLLLTFIRTLKEEEPKGIREEVFVSLHPSEEDNRTVSRPFSVLFQIDILIVICSIPKCYWSFDYAASKEISSVNCNWNNLTLFFRFERTGSTPKAHKQFRSTYNSTFVPDLSEDLEFDW